MKAERIQLISRTLRGQEDGAKATPPAEGPRETWRLQLEGWASAAEEFVFSQLDRAEPYLKRAIRWADGQPGWIGAVGYLTAGFGYAVGVFTVLATLVAVNSAFYAGLSLVWLMVRPSGRGNG